MNLSNLASVSEIIGSVAILATLIFLVLQMKQNTRAIEASASQDAADSESNAIVQLLNYPEIATCLTKDELSDVEVVRLFAYLSLLLRAHEQYWRQYEFPVIQKLVDRIPSSFRSRVFGQGRRSAAECAYSNG